MSNFDEKIEQTQEELKEEIRTSVSAVFAQKIQEAADKMNSDKAEDEDWEDKDDDSKDKDKDNVNEEESDEEEEADEEEDEEDEEVNESTKLKLVKTEKSGNNEAKIYWNPEWEEFVVKFYENGKYNAKADYHSDDKQDAMQTAKRHGK